MSEENTTQAAEPVKRQRTLIGTVVSNQIDKTIVVRVDRRVKHRVIGKFIMRSAKYKVHDESNQYNDGVIVEIAAGRPISHHIAWTAVRRVEPARITCCVATALTTRDPRDYVRQGIADHVLRPKPRGVHLDG